ncbi:MAG: helix-turn-helix domain-containing protein [Cyanobacteriota bacterium]
MPELERLRVPQVMPSSHLRIASGHTVHLTASTLHHTTSLQVVSGLVRVSCSSGEQEPLAVKAMTLGFLQAGDHLALDLLRRSWLHLEAITPVQMASCVDPLPLDGASGLCDWTAALLRIHHLGASEDRLRALFQLLADRLGRRCGDWVELPLRLTHDRCAELIGHNRVTVTRHLSRWRQQGLFDPDGAGTGAMRLSPLLLHD